MKNIIIARYGEIHLKGGNKGFFLRALKQNIVKAVGKRAVVSIENSRVILRDFADTETECENLCGLVANTFGITGASPAACIESTPEAILGYVKTLSIEGKFKAEVNRANKKFPYKSPEFAAMVGGIVLENNSAAIVDVHNPDTIINIDIRENGNAFVFDEVIKGVGGMPVGTAGRALVLISGGIDSPVAAWLSAKRGLVVDCLHFASPPYTSDFALEKVNDLVTVLTGFCGNVKLNVAPFTEIQEEIKARCNGEYMITLMRRFMVRLATRFAETYGYDCIITGENLAQVASQTVQGIASNNLLSGAVPILRPLVTYDKEEIITLARKIGTYDLSCKPYPDCCTVFVPRHPSIKPSIKKLEAEEAKLDVDGLIDRCFRAIDMPR
jgi:thiamine biosynthesis protein ThiI